MTNTWKNLSKLAFIKELLAKGRSLISKLKSFIKSLKPKTRKNDIKDLERRVSNLEILVNNHTIVINSIAKSYPEAIKSIGNLAQVQAEISKTVAQIGINVKKLDTQANENLINLFRD